MKTKIKALIKLIFPPRCAVCDRLMDFRTRLPACPQCLSEFRALTIQGRISPMKYHSGGIFLFVFEDNKIRRMIYSYKKLQTANARKLFAQALSERLMKSPLAAFVDVITFVPRLPLSERLIGSDQAKALAMDTARLCKIPCEALLIRRDSKAPAQKSLSATERRKNVHNHFRPSKKLCGKNVLLIDDVLTTGETADECARMLKKAGAEKIFVAVLAH